MQLKAATFGGLQVHMKTLEGQEFLLVVAKIAS
jgi:hypothetical protein